MQEPLDNDDIKKVFLYLKQISPFFEDISSVENIARSALANQVQKEGKGVFKCTMNSS